MVILMLGIKSRRLDADENQEDDKSTCQSGPPREDFPHDRTDPISLEPVLHRATSHPRILGRAVQDRQHPQPGPLAGLETDETTLLRRADPARRQERDFRSER